MTTRLSRALSVSFVCAASTCAAADNELFEDHHAHEHGVATLEVAIDGPALQLHFRSPAMNLLGFEHAPRTAEDRAALMKAMELLREPAAQFTPSADAVCRVKTSNVTAPDWKHASTHSEFAAEYVFTCERPAALLQLHVRLLNALDEHVKLEVQVSSPQGQHAAELTRSSPRLSLRGRR